jgi:hypothetical protein
VPIRDRVLTIPRRSSPDVVFPRTGGADDGDVLTGCDAQVHTAQHVIVRIRVGVVGEPQVLEHEARGGGRGPGRSPRRGGSLVDDADHAGQGGTGRLDLVEEADEGTDGVEETMEDQGRRGHGSGGGLAEPDEDEAGDEQQ